MEESRDEEATAFPCLWLAHRRNVISKFGKISGSVSDLVVRETRHVLTANVKPFSNKRGTSIFRETDVRIKG